jgi:hypothetical protein
MGRKRTFWLPPRSHLRLPLTLKVTKPLPNPRELTEPVQSAQDSPGPVQGKGLSKTGHLRGSGELVTNNCI